VFRDFARAQRCAALALLLLLTAALSAHGHPHGASPVSPIPGGQGGGSPSSDLDLFADVTAWQSLDFRFAFSPSFTLEAGIDGVFDFGGGKQALDLADLHGGFALIFKPGM
jgi:hypothetical protein